VTLDPQRFQQVLLNYLSNALKFTNVNGRIRILIQVINAHSNLDEATAAWMQLVQDFLG